MKHFLNHMRLQAQRVSAADVVSLVGTVKSYDPNYHAARVQLQAPATGTNLDGLLTGWLPIASMWIGNGWGMFSPPTPGNMCTIVCINGDINGGYLESRFWNDVDRPLAVEAGEFWLVHANGQYLKLTNDGKLTVSDGQGATVTLDGDGTITSAASNWSHTGPMSIDGNVSITGNETVSGTVTATTDVVGGGISLKSHVHGGVEGGSSDTTPPV